MYSPLEIDNLNIDNSDFINILSELNINDNINNNKKRKIDDCDHKITLNDNSAIIYARCSSKKQDSDHHQSLLCQVSKCLDYCTNMKLNVKYIIKDIKPGHELHKLSVFNILNQYENCNIIIMDPSRLSRSVSQANDFIIKCLSVNWAQVQMVMALTCPIDAFSWHYPIYPLTIDRSIKRARME